MSEHRTRVVEGRYLGDILDQPRALGETLRHLRSSPELDALVARLKDGWSGQMVLTGMGSSYHGLYPLHLRLVEAGRRVAHVEASELLYYQSHLLQHDTVLVLLSQSGRSAEIVRLLEICPKAASTLAVSNTADSPLVRQATATVLTHAGKEATVACKTHLTAQAALVWLGTALSGADPEGDHEVLASAQSGVERYLASWRDHVRELAALLDGTRAVYYVGRGPSLGTAGAAGLITKEATHRPSEGMSSAAFRHGPMEMLNEGVVVLVFAGEPKTRALNEALVEDIRAAGGRVFLVADDAETAALRLPPVPGLARPIVELLPVEMVTLALAALDGREAGTFRVGGKVTTVE
jgi:glucosamine--fructose-6-phosphate aminotransferase (isomerizing)